MIKREEKVTARLNAKEALAAAKAREAQRLEAGAVYERIDNRTIILRNDKKPGFTTSRKRKA